MRALISKTLFVLSILLSAQASAFDIGGFSYSITSVTTVEVTGRAVGNTWFPSPGSISLAITAYWHRTTDGVGRSPRPNVAKM